MRNGLQLDGWYFDVWCSRSPYWEVSRETSRSSGNTEVTSDRATGLAFIGVISQTEARLDKYVEFLARRRKVTNLTSERAFSQVWTRHLADCAQLLGYAPFARRCVDLGSGAGFPEMVVAILLAEMQGRAEVHRLESDQRKCPFLREVTRATDAPARIHGSRIEMFDPCLLSLVDAVTSRALAPLPSLVANELLMLRATGILLRGRSAAQTETLSVASQFQFKSFRNNFDPDARIDCVPSRAQAQK